MYLHILVENVSNVFEKILFLHYINIFALVQWHNKSSIITSCPHLFFAVHGDGKQAIY